MICTHISEPIALIGNKRASNGIMKGVLVVYFAHDCEKATETMVFFKNIDCEG